MGFCKFQAVKFSQSREIYRCTRKRQSCTRNRHTSGRGSPPDRSIRLCACGTPRTADWYNERLNLCGGESVSVTVPVYWPCYAPAKIKRGGHFGVLTRMWVFSEYNLIQGTQLCKVMHKPKLGLRSTSLNANMYAIPAILYVNRRSVILIK